MYVSNDEEGMKFEFYVLERVLYLLLYHKREIFSDIFKCFLAQTDDIIQNVVILK